MPPRHPQIADAMGRVRAVLCAGRDAAGLGRSDELRLLVACSGGRDSVALLGLLALLAQRDRLTLFVGHVDHGLRSASAQEAEHVRALAGRLSIPCRVATPTIDLGSGLAARAREARHDALRSMLQADAAHAVVLAHTATDQAETVLLNLARGAGLDGLAGMARVDLPRLRPLLELTRAQTTDLCAHLGLPYVDDPTNLDEAHLRVRVRESVLPTLRSDRGGVDSSIAAAADVVREADEALCHWVARELEARREGDAFDLQGWAQLPRGFRVRWLRACLLEGGVPADAIGRRVLDSIDAGIVRGGAKRWDLAGKQVQVRDRRLRVVPVDLMRTPPGPPM